MKSSGAVRFVAVMAICWAGASLGGCDTGGSLEQAHADDVDLPAGVLAGVVRDAGGEPLSGVMMTAYDPVGHRSISVYSGDSGEYRFPVLEPGRYELRVRRLGYASESSEPLDLARSGARKDFSLERLEAFSHQLPASYYHAELVEAWSDEQMRNNFILACGNCHQIGNREWQKYRTPEAWEAMIESMLAKNGPPFADSVRPHVVPTLMKVFGPDAPDPDFRELTVASGEALDAVIREYELAPGESANCHDPELGPGGIVYSEDGNWLDPESLERGRFPVDRGSPHSIKAGPDGNLWITITGTDNLARLDPDSGDIRYYEHPVIDGRKGVYPHTLKFDDRGRIWYTLTASNQVARFDPATEQFVYFELPAGIARSDVLQMGAHNDLAVAYGLDIAPDGGIWWSQLYGSRIGRLDPETGDIQHWTTPVGGPRRLGVGPDGRVWVPFYGPSRLGRFDPATEEWKLYEFPGPTDGELPYALSVNRRTGEVWVAGSNSDTMLRFDPQREAFTVYPLPSPNNFTRDIVFDDEGNAWTCSGATLISAEEQHPGPGRIIKIEPGADSRLQAQR